MPLVGHLRIKFRGRKIVSKVAQPGGGPPEDKTSRRKDSFQRSKMQGRKEPQVPKFVAVCASESLGAQVR